MTKQPYYNAILASGYIVGIVHLIQWFTGFQGIQQTILIPIGMLSLLVLSVSVMGFLFFYHPLLLLLEGKQQQAVTRFLKTVGTFAVLTAFFFATVGLLGLT